MKSCLLTISKEMRISLTLIVVTFLLLFSAKPIYCQESFFDSNEENRKNACQGYYSLALVNKTTSGERWILKDNDNNIASIDIPVPPSKISLYTCIDIVVFRSKAVQLAAF